MKIVVHPNLDSNSGNSQSVNRDHLILGFGAQCPICNKIHKRSILYKFISFVISDVGFSFYSRSLAKCIQSTNPKYIDLHHAHMIYNLPLSRNDLILNYKVEVLESLIYKKLSSCDYKYFLLGFFRNPFLKTERYAIKFAKTIETFSEIEYSHLFKICGDKVLHKPFISSLPVRQFNKVPINKIGVIGNFNWPPNKLLIDSLVRKSDMFSNIEFVFTSRIYNYSKLMKKLKSSSIKYIVVDDCNEKDFLDSVDAIWCVTSIGGGVRTKLINALTYGKYAYVSKEAIVDNLVQLKSFKNQFEIVE